MYKRMFIIALAVMAGATFNTVNAGKKKKGEPKQEVKVPVVLSNGSDSVSYAAGQALTKGLLPYLMQQLHVDTAYMADFVKGFTESVTNESKQFVAYNAGANIASQVKGGMIPQMIKEFTDTPDSVVTALVYRGFTDALSGDTAVMKFDAADKLFQAKRASNKAAKEEKLYGANRKAGEKFLAENATKEGVVVLPSGLQYKVLVKGDGKVPTASDKVQVHYEGRLIDGTVFDASKKHGDKPAEFVPTQVIKGWTEALTMMPVGSKWQLYIPHNLAYGDRAAGQIPPYSTLIFDVELVGINH
jgi:FKBP-type peptidyl-prolyl cis-trans isomerase FklB